LRAEASLVKIESPETVVALGRTHHANVTFTSETDARVPGTAFRIGDSELNLVDTYEAAYSYRRMLGRLASGRRPGSASMRAAMVPVRDAEWH